MHDGEELGRYEMNTITYTFCRKSEEMKAELLYDPADSAYPYTLRLCDSNVTIFLGSKQHLTQLYEVLKPVVEEG